MDQEKDVKLLENSLLKQQPANLIDMDDKSDVLETPQINSFKHENNVFGQAFKGSIGFQRVTSLSEIDTPSITEILNNPTTATSILSPPAPPPPLTNGQQTFPDQQTTFRSSSVAPKKAILIRETSRNDAEKQQEIKDKSLLEPEPKYNVPLLEQLDSKIDFTPNIPLKGSIIGGKIETPIIQPTITDTIVNNNNNSVPNILNTLTSLNTSSRSSELLKAAEIPVVKSDLLKDNSSETNPSTFATLTPVLGMSSKAASAAASKANAKALNIAEKMKKLNREEKLLSESSTNGDSLMSFNSASSNDEMVTSSDMNHPKPKKRRLMELNTEARKEQIRSSNREAARRCRERRRNYIELLENKIKGLENTIKELTKENSTLKKMFSENKNCLILNNQYDFKTNNNVMNSGTTAMLTQSQMTPNAIYLPVQMPNEKATTSQIVGASQLDLNQQQAAYHHHQQHQHPTASNDKNADKTLNPNLLDLNTNTQLMQLLGVKQQSK